MLGNQSCCIYIIALDAVKLLDQEKLAFFSPDDNKYCFPVMLFGPTNAPTFYTAVMQDFKTEWDNLF